MCECMKGEINYKKQFTSDSIQSLLSETTISQLKSIKLSGNKVDSNNISDLNLGSKISEKIKSSEDLYFEKYRSSEIESDFSNDDAISTEEGSLKNKNEFFEGKNLTVRNSYIGKLMSLNVWSPKETYIKRNSIIIFDWDDTLFPTTFLTQRNQSIQRIVLSRAEQEELETIEETCVLLLTMAFSTGNTFIVTNAEEGWVEFSSQIFFPRLWMILKNVTIISARKSYEKYFPFNPIEWKIRTFQDIKSKFNDELITNIVSVGDSEGELISARMMAKEFEHSVFKTVKFRKEPSMIDIIKQLKMLKNKFNDIFSKGKNVCVTFEKKEL